MVTMANIIDVQVERCFVGGFDIGENEGINLNEATDLFDQGEIKLK